MRKMIGISPLTQALCLLQCAKNIPLSKKYIKKGKISNIVRMINYTRER